MTFSIANLPIQWPEKLKMIFQKSIIHIADIYRPYTQQKKVLIFPNFPNGYLFLDHCATQMRFLFTFLYNFNRYLAQSVDISQEIKNVCTVISHYITGSGIECSTSLMV